MDVKPNQKITIFGVTATVTESGDEVIIDDQDFIQQLIDLGFKEGRNNSVADLERILKNAPEKYRQNFWDGFHNR